MMQLQEDEFMWLDIDDIEADNEELENLPNVETLNSGTPVLPHTMPPVWTEENAVDLEDD